MAIEIKTYNQILGDMIRKVIAETSLNDINDGSVLLTLLEAAATVDFENNSAILNILELLNIDVLRDSDLDSRAADFGLTRNVAQKASGFISISDSSITKRSTGLYQVKSAPISGQTAIFVNDASGWDASGTIYIGRGTPNFEGPINYSSITNNGTFYTLNLDSALQRDHLISDVVVDAQNTSDRFVSAGTVVKIPASSQNPEVLYFVLRDTTLPAGEDTVTDVAVVAEVGGKNSNAGISTITQFTAAPFANATCVNTIAFTNGSDIESDDDLRERIKAFGSTLARGTKPAILAAVIGTSDSDDGKQVASANITEPPVIGDPSILYIDDGTGFQPSTAGQSVDTLLANASGNEEFLQLANYPLPRPEVTNTADGPYVLANGMQIKVLVDGVEEVITFSIDSFVNITASSLSEVIVAINSQSSLFKARFTDNSTRILLYPTSHKAETIQVVAQSSAEDTDANAILKFPTNEFSYIRLYKNSTLLTESSSAASLVTNTFSTWNIITSGNIILSVDGTPAQNQTFTTTDFGGAAFATLTLSDWVTAFNNKFAGITAEATASDELRITSNRVGSTSALAVTGGTYQDNWFANTETTASGTSSDFQLNRQNGNLRILADIEPNDTISAGTEDARGSYISIESQTGVYNVSSDGNSRDSNIILSIDSDSAKSRNITVTNGDTITLRNLGGGLTRLTSSSDNTFGAAQPGDFIYITSRGGSGITGAEWIHPDNCGLHKIITKGDHISPGDDTYIEYKQAAVTETGMVANIDTVTFPALAGITDGDYFIVYDVNGLGWIVALDTTGGASQTPTGATWAATPASRRSYLDISGATTGADVAALVEAEINTFAGFTSVITTNDSAADGTMTFTNTSVGTVPSAATFNFDDNTAGTISVINSTAGAYGVHTIEASEDIQIFQSSEYPQLWQGAFLTTPAAGTVQEIVDSINNDLTNISASVYKTNSVKISSSSETDGSITLPVSVSNATTVFPTAQERQVGNPSHIAHKVTGKDAFTFFKRTSPTNTTAGGVANREVWLGRHTYGDQNSVLLAAAAPNPIYTSGYSENISSSIFDNTVADSDDVVFFLGGNNKRQYRSIKEILAANFIGTQQAKPRTLMDHVTTDKVGLVRPLQLNPNDSIVLIVDQDAVAKTIDIPLSRSGIVNTDVAVSATVFSANDLDGEEGVGFDDTQVWGTATNNTDFKDYALWMRARNWYSSGGAPAGANSGELVNGTMIVRAGEYGPHGENLRFKLEYPSAANSASSVSHQNDGASSTTTYFFGSGGGRTTGVTSGSGVKIYDVSSITSYAGYTFGVMRYEFVANGLDFSAVLVGDVMGISEEAGFTNSANAGAYRILGINDVDGNRYVDVYNPNAVLTNVGFRERTEITSPAEGSVQEVTQIVADTFANTVDGEYFDLNAQIGTGYRVWMDKVGDMSGIPAAGGRTLVAVDISGVASAADVGDAVAAAINGLANYSCPPTGTGTILATDVNYGAAIDADGSGIPGGSWAISTSVDGVDSAIDGEYFLIYDVAGLVCVWFNVSGSAVQPAVGATRYLEITDITAGMTAAQVGDRIASNVDSDSQYTATAISEVVTITDASVGIRTDATLSAGFITAGASIVILQNGVEDGTEVILLPTLFSIYPLLNTDVASIIESVNAGQLLKAVAVGDDARVLSKATRDEVYTPAGPGDYSVSLGYGHNPDPGYKESTSITTVADTAGSLDGTYFILPDGPSTTVAFWYDVDNSGTAEPAHGAPRSVEITTVATNDNAFQVAQKTAIAINADEGFTCSNTDGYTETELFAIDTEIGAHTSVSDAGTSGFTLSQERAGTDGSLGAHEYITLHDGINWIQSFQNANPHFTLKDTMVLQGVPDASTYAIDNNPNDDIAALGEQFKLVPTTPENVYHHFTQKALSQLPIIAEVDYTDMKRKIQIKSQQLGSDGSVEVVGGNANAASFSIFGESQTVNDNDTDHLAVTISAFPDTLSKGDLVELTNSVGTPRLSRTGSSDSVDVSSETGTDNMWYEYNPKTLRASEHVRFTISDVSVDTAKVQTVTTKAEGYVKEVSTIVADTRANTTSGWYFDIDASDNTQYRVWLDKNGDGSTDAPAAGGRALTAVDISVGTIPTDNIGNIGDAVAAVLDAIDDFDCPATGTGTIIVTDANFGGAVDINIGTLGAGWSVTNTVQGEDYILDGTFWTFYSTGNIKGFYVWYNSDSGSAPDPAPAGFDYGIEVVISSTDSADTIAAATAAAIDANYYYNQYFNPTGYISGSDVVITSNTVGDANDIADGSTATNFAFAVTTEGCAHGRAAGTVWRWRHSDTGSNIEVTDVSNGVVAGPASYSENGTPTSTRIEIASITAGTASTPNKFTLGMVAAPIVQGDFFHMTATSGNTYSLWFDLDGLGTEPTAVAHTGATYKLRVGVTSNDTENEIVDKMVTVLNNSTDFNSDFTLLQVAGISYTNINEGDLLQPHQIAGSNEFVQGNTTSTWNAGNIAFDTGSDRVGGWPIVQVDAANRFIDVVNPFGSSMVDTKVGNGLVTVTPTPKIKWNLRHIAKVELNNVDTTAGDPTNIITTNTPHGLKTGDEFSILDNSTDTNDTGLIVLEVLTSLRARYGGVYASTTADGGHILKTMTNGASVENTQYKVELLGYNDLVRISYASGHQPLFLDSGVAVDDIITISGTTFLNANRGTFRILGVDQDYVIIQNPDAVEEVNTTEFFNNLSTAVTWTSSSDAITGSIGDFKNLSTGDWVKKVEDSDDMYVQVSGFEEAGGAPTTAALAEVVRLVDAYSGTSADAIGQALDTVNGIGTGVKLRGLDDIAIYEGDGVQVGDNLFVDSITNANWFSSLNTGTYEVVAFGTTADNKPYISIENPTGTVETDRLLSVSTAGLAVQEGVANPFKSIRQVAHIVWDETNTSRKTVYLTPSNRSYKYSRTNGTAIAPIGKFDYEVGIVSGIDGYKYYTGLLRTVQRIVDGFEPDPATYPGRRAIGGIVETLPPLINSIVLSINVTTNEGINLNEISANIKSGIIDYVDSLGVGEDVVLSEIIVTVMGITGVEAATMSIPSPSNERIAVADNEKAFVDPNNISIA